jgi:putative copper export protein/methionine-rich copper-binding protein CopC
VKRLIRGALPLAVALMALLSTAATASAAPPQPTASSAAANAVLGSPPQRIVVDDPGGAPGRVTVYDSSHTAVASVPARPADGALVAPLPHLSSKAGIYSVVWHAGGESGSFAFQVSPGRASPALVQQPQPDNSLTPVKEALPRYFAFAFIFVFIGTLALRFFVTAPTIRKLAGARPRLAAAVDRRLLLTAAVTIALFIPATIIELANEPTNLFEGGDGTLWLVRLVLTAIAAAAVIPAALMSLAGRDLPARRVATVAAIGLTAGVAELLARVIPTETPDEWAREIFTDLLDFGHMAGASVWIGGLVALGVLAATLRLSASERDGFWSAALRRFSVVATVCVGVMILTGLWTACRWSATGGRGCWSTAKPRRASRWR